MEAEDGGQPLVIDKTKEIQVSVYPVYIDYRKCGSPTHGPCVWTILLILYLNIGRWHYLNSVAA